MVAGGFSPSAAWADEAGVAAVCCHTRKGDQSPPAHLFSGFWVVINDAGEVSDSHGDFLSTDGSLSNIGIRAEGINASGNVVGAYSDHRPSVAGLYRKDLDIIDLNTLVPEALSTSRGYGGLISANAMNDLGQIAVMASTFFELGTEEFFMTLPHFCDVRLDRAAEVVGFSGSVGTLTIVDQTALQRAHVDKRQP